MVQKFIISSFRNYANCTFSWILMHLLCLLIWSIRIHWNEIAILEQLINSITNVLQIRLLCLIGRVKRHIPSSDFLYLWISEFLNQDNSDSKNSLMQHTHYLSVLTEVTVYDIIIKYRILYTYEWQMCKMNMWCMQMYEWIKINVQQMMKDFILYCITWYCSGHEIRDTPYFSWG